MERIRESRKAIGWGHISELRKIDAQHLASSPEPSMPSNLKLSNLSLRPYTL